MANRLSGNSPQLLLALWQRPDLACRGVPTEYFCPPEGISPSQREDMQKIAKECCARCPALVQCRDYARSALEEGGVFGGEDEGERLAAIIGEDEVA